MQSEALHGTKTKQIERKAKQSDYKERLVWLRGDSVGNYYKLEGTDKQGWLCPAMFHYYKTAPKDIYVKADPK